MPAEDLDLDTTLSSGQCFRWRRGQTGDWVGPVGDTIVRLRRQGSRLGWQTYPDADRWSVVDSYLALDVDLRAVQRDWLHSEPRMQACVRRWQGLRVVRQEGWEALIAFIGSACNTIMKITRSVRALADEYGEPLGEVDGVRCAGFPGPERLTRAPEQRLRELLWGFRAPYVRETAAAVLGRGGTWLDDLTTAPYDDAHAALSALPGVGPKVADCVCLFGLGKHEAVPVDRHVRRIVERWYGPRTGGASLTPTAYRALGAALRERLGPFAGWAQQYLFMDEVAAGRSRAFVASPLAPEEGEPCSSITH
ncbi:MAG TPA: DNA glycosylase [Chthonomonadales bacterium]|nr:DNA glycosylase [Chthonomonadales bacterium]